MDYNYRHFKNGKINLMFGRNMIGAITIVDTDKPSPFITHLDIKTKYQGKGYGTLLLRYALDSIVGKEAVSLYVDISNIGAIKLYRRFGFFISFSVVRKVKSKRFYCMTKKLV